MPWKITTVLAFAVCFELLLQGYKRSHQDEDVDLQFLPIVSYPINGIIRSSEVFLNALPFLVLLKNRCRLLY